MYLFSCFYPAKFFTGVHRRTYTNLQGLRQPSVIRTLRIGRNDFLFTADEGHTRYYTKAAHTFDWTDDTLARTQGERVEMLNDLIIILEN